jgi:hypothetical protein
MKDYWRVAAEVKEKEGDIYKDLHHCRVPHIPEFDCGNDVFEQETLGHTFPLGMWCKKDIDCYRHYRISILTVGRSLVSFKSSYEYVNAIADVMEGEHIFRTRGIIIIFTTYLAHQSALVSDTVANSNKRRQEPGSHSHNERPTIKKLQHESRS